MDSISAKLYTVLSEDAELSGLLGPSVIEPTRAAVYTTIPVPPGASLPYVVAYASNVFATDEDPLDEPGAASTYYARVGRDIHCYAARPDDGGGSASLVQDLAARVRQLLHRKPVILDDGRMLSMRAAPAIANDGDEAFGRVVSLDILVATAAPI